MTSARANDMQTDVAIIGGGLSGLALARQLQNDGIDFQLFEARNRLGGRIDALKLPGGAVELGPSWLWPGQPRMAALLKDLGLRSFAQYSQGLSLAEDAAGRVHKGAGYASMAGALRIEGGAARLIDALARTLPQERLHLSAPAQALSEAGQVTLEDGRICRAGTTVLALPPRIAARLTTSPALPEPAMRALTAIPTWMAGHAKFVAAYDAPFWRDAALSGDAVSAIGPLAEIHDASGPNGAPAALFGFVGVPADQRRDHAQALKDAAIDQLARLFGPAARAPIATALMDWATAPETATEADRHPPRMHPAYGLPRAVAGLWDGRLLFAGAEMADDMGGLMEGALASANAVAARIGGA
ncbi:flavin monoamine oxidase family protein [Roseovarius sp. S1116L3]|uniref:flavin monoamine oxidase family protein n=1 Tax=Roseovarius roseus TaxID=3342636 RepID=UPI003729F091